VKIVIMAGGQGTRFWPLSRQECPKQFLSITAERTMLQETVARLDSFVPLSDVFVVCSGAYAAVVRSQLPTLSEDQIIVEPTARSTAPCIGLAALHLRRRFGDQVMVVLTADHSIGAVGEFHSVLRSAAALAEDGWLVTFGIEAAFPATGYGYVQRGEKIGEPLGNAAYVVSNFTEKPDLETARRFIESGRYYWNSGMFVWRTETVLSKIRIHMPDLHGVLAEIDRHPDDRELTTAAFCQAPSVPIDRGVMEKASKEKASKVALIPCRLGWSDVGNWQAVEEILPRDAQGIASNARYVAVDSRDCLIHAARGKLLALVGVHDLVVVDTPDALLVCRRDRVEDVKKVVEELQRRGEQSFL
jgi:mannose-1-phosphate guanylyltransferase